MIQKFYGLWLILPVLLLILLLPIAGSAAEAYPPRDWQEENPATDFNYSLTEDGQGIVIDGYIGEDFWEVVIPREIDGLPVVEIADFAFYSHRGETVSRVCMPDTVTSIGREAFIYSALSEIHLSEALTDIGPDAFASTWLETLRLPAALLRLDPGVLAGCEHLTNIDTGNNPHYVFENGMLLEDGVVILYLETSQAAHIDIPAGTVGIGDGVFEGRTEIQSVSFPNTVTSIGFSAFTDCASLADVRFQAGGLVDIENWAFAGCIGLSSVSLAASYIGDFAFSGCTALNRVELLPGLASIGNYAFAGCTGLGELAFPQGLERIGSMAFFGTAISSLVLPGSVIEIALGDDFFGDRAAAFYGMPSLALVTIGDNPVYRVDGNNLVMEGRVLFDPRIQEAWYEFDEMKTMAEGMMAYQSGEKWGLLAQNLSIPGEPAYDSISICDWTGQEKTVGVRDGREYEINPELGERPHDHSRLYQPLYIYWDENEKFTYYTDGEVFDMMPEGIALLAAFPIGANGAAYPDARYVVVDQNNTVVGQDYEAAYCDLETYTGTAVLVLENNVWRVFDGRTGLVPEYDYQDARDFSFGFAAVKTDTGWGYVNNHGAPVTDFSYDEVTDMTSNAVFPLYAYGRKNGVWQTIFPTEEDKGRYIESALPMETAPPPASALELPAWRDRGLPLFIAADFGRGQQSYYALDFLNGLFAFKGLGASLGDDGTQQLFLYGSVIEDRTEYKFYEPVLQNGIWYLEEYDMDTLLDEVIWWYITEMAEDQRAEQDVIIDGDNRPALRMDHVADAFKNLFFNTVSFTEHSPLDWSYSINGSPPQPLGEYELMEWDGNGYMEMDRCLALAQRITVGK